MSPNHNGHGHGWVATTGKKQRSWSGWLFTNVCRTYATTDVVRHNAYRRYDLFTTSVADLWPVVRHRQVCRRFTLIFTPVLGAPCFVNNKWCGIDVVRPAYVEEEQSYDRSWIDLLQVRARDAALFLFAVRTTDTVRIFQENFAPPP